MPSRFLIKQNENDEYYFNFVDSADELILISANYPDKSLVDEAIKDLKVNSLMSQQLAGGKTKDGGQFFVIKGTDGNVLVKSVLYTSQMLMDNALHCVKDNACVAESEDLSIQAA